MRKFLVCTVLALLVACSGGGASSGMSNSPNPVPTVPSPELSMFAGSAGGSGNLDGAGAQARFDSPQAIARDQDGNFYVADSWNHTIRKISASGVVSTLAGASGVPGYADGNGAEARFFHPTGLTVDRAGNVYVADDLNDVIRKITPTGQVSTFAGTAGSTGQRDGMGTEARLSLCDQDDLGCGSPGMAVDSAGNLYFTDLGNRAIRKITAAGMVSTLALQQCAYPLPNGSDAKCFDRLGGLTIDEQDGVFVADGARVRRLSPAGEFVAFAGSREFGDNDGQGAGARFTNIGGLCFAGGQLTVLESRRVRTVAANGQVTTISGAFNQEGYVDGNERDARYGYLYAAAGDASGNVYVADAGNHSIRKISATRSVSTFAGLGLYRAGVNYGDGTVSFSTPAGIVADKSGNVYVADLGAGSVQKITPTGQASLFARNNFISGTAFPYPQGITIDKDGTVYLTDTAFDNVLKILPNGSVSTMVLSFTPGTIAGLYVPRGIAAAGDGNLYLADTGHNLIRKINASGQVSTLAGDTGDKFNFPNGIAIDANGNLFVADSFNHTIRKIRSDGTVSTIAGSPGQPGSTDGNGVQARFNAPQSLTFDANGNLYVADSFNNTVRKITPAGNVSTIAGVAGQRGFIGGQLPGRLTHPYALAVFGSSLYVTMDGGVAVIRNLP